jgi:hypothetical protein
VSIAFKAAGVSKNGVTNAALDAASVATIAYYGVYASVSATVKAADTSARLQLMPLVILLWLPLFSIAAYTFLLMILLKSLMFQRWMPPMLPVMLLVPLLLLVLSIVIIMLLPMLPVKLCVTSWHQFFNKPTLNISVPDACGAIWFVS